MHTHEPLPSGERSPRAARWVSNCDHVLATLIHGESSRIIAFKIVRNLCMQAVSATLGGLPRARRR